MNINGIKNVFPFGTVYSPLSKRTVQNKKALFPTKAGKMVEGIGAGKSPFEKKPNVGFGVTPGCNGLREPLKDFEKENTSPYGEQSKKNVIRNDRNFPPAAVGNNGLPREKRKLTKPPASPDDSTAAPVITG